MIGSIKHLARRVANSTAFDKFVELLEKSKGERENLFRVLTYHRVDHPEAQPRLDPALISATPEVFEAQMKYLATNYEVVSSLDIGRAFENGDQGTLPARAVTITFDDAYCDFAKYAWPILKQYRIPVTLFVPTAFPDHPERLFWWDRVYDAMQLTEKRELNTPAGSFPINTSAQRDQVCRLLKNHIKTLPNDVAIEEVDKICNELGVSPQENCVLSWDSLRTLSKEGVTLGAHTRTHPIMNNLTHDDMYQEAVGSKQDLDRETGIDPDVFAYPSGIHNDNAVNTVEQAGFTIAFTTERGTNEVGNADRFRLRRINVGTNTTIPILRAQLLPLPANLYSLSGKFL